MANNFLPAVPRLPPMDVPHTNLHSGRPASPIVQASPTLQPPSSPSVLPLPSLRKSISIDSFIRQTLASARRSPSVRQPTVAAHNPHRGIPGDAQHASTSSATFPPVSRLRRGSARLPESSFKRVGSLAAMDGRARAESFQADAVRPHMSTSGPSAGELRLPRRSLNSGAVKRDSPEQARSGSDQSDLRISIPSGRERSGSMASHASSSADPRSGGKALPTSSNSLDDSDVYIAVVGEYSCGKSTVIRKGLKRYSLTDPQVDYVPESTDGASFRCVRRRGRVVPYPGEDRTFSVVEVDVACLATNLEAPYGVIWPDGAPRLEGVIVCYDASNEASFRCVRGLLSGYAQMKLPTVVIACKTDLVGQVDPRTVANLLRKFDAGLVEANVVTEAGKAKIRGAFDWLFKAIFRDIRRSIRTDNRVYHNPASPTVLFEPTPWDEPRSDTATPTPASLGMRSISPGLDLAGTPQAGRSSTPLSPHSVPTSPSRARSMNDLMLENERFRNRGRELEREKSVPVVGSEDVGTETTLAVEEGTPKMPASIQESRKDDNDRDLRPPRWQTVDELIYKLLFAGIAGDDRTYVWRFLLVYRCFTSPRHLLLSMQKSLRSFDNSESVDVVFASFAQMRICHVLDTWTKDYPTDFATPGAAPALAAIVRSFATKPHLLHYTSSFLPFLEVIPRLIDSDVLWASKVEDLEESDVEDESRTSSTDSHAPGPGASTATLPDVANSPASAGPSFAHSTIAVSQTAKALRDRKSSLPFSGKGSSLATISSGPSSGSYESLEAGQRQILRDLLVVSQDLASSDPGAVAKEITRQQLKMFLEIKPRDWLHFAYRYSKKELAIDSVARFSYFVNQLAEWVVSLILCHDKAKSRAKQIERLVDVAERLRLMDNYSACRSFVAGINQTTLDGDLTMDIFMRRAPEKYNMFRSYNILFKNQRAHGAYRQDLRTVKGACVPDVEVHASDILKAHEGNVNHDPNNPAKIHWAKWNMIARFIHELVQLQEKARRDRKPDFDDQLPLDFEGENRATNERQERLANIRREQITISNMWRESVIMDTEMQLARMVSPGDAHLSGDYYLPDKYRHMDRGALPRADSRSEWAKDSLRRLAFWS